MPKRSAAQQAARIAATVKRQVLRNLSKGLRTGAIFLTARVKETLSTPAPRAPLNVNGVKVGYRATTKATKGAPPRKLSGRLRTSVTYEMRGETTAVIGSNARGLPTPAYPSGFNYPKYHELKQPNYAGSGQHQFLRATAEKYQAELKRIIGSGFTFG